MTGAMPMTTARRVILILGVPVALAVLAAGAYNAAAQTYQVGYRVHLSVPPSGQRARVPVDNADASVRPGAGSRIVVDGTFRGSFARPAFSSRQTATDLALHSSCRLGFEGLCTMTLDISVPGGVPVAVTDTNGDLTASGLRGRVTLSDGSGDITASGLSGSIRLSDGSGDITLVLPRGPAAYQVLASSASGAVSDGLKQRPSAPCVIVVRSGSGDVSIGY